MKTTRWQVSVLALLMALAACSKKSEETGSETADSAQAQAEHAASGAEVSGNRVDPKNLGTLVDLIVAEAADLPRAEFDPAALAANLGNDPQAHFEWVRDHTWWAPYRGLLRGSQGVMLDRVGSSLDRAVLLGDLLRRSGHEVRLAHAQLSESQALGLMAKLRPMPEQRRGRAALAATSAERQRSAESVIPGLAKTLQQRNAESKRRLDAGAALVRSQADQLYARVKDAASSNGDTAEESAVAALRDHWWVEREDNGKWIPLDVLMPDAEPGEALIRASRTDEWNAASEWPSVPAGDWHTVRVRVVIERYLAGETTESIVLETVLRPAEVFDRTISLFHFPKPWPDQVASAATNPDALREAALNVRQWTPILRVGDDVIAQSGFTESGDIKTHPFDPTADLGGGGLFGGLDSALGGGEEYEPYASAEWIDYEIRVPGEPSQRVRRQLFDLLGPGRRLTQDPNFNGNAEERRLERAETLLSKTDILLLTCEFTDEFIAHLATAGIVSQQEAIRELSLERDIGKRRSKATDIVNRMGAWGPVLGFASWRSALGSQRGDWFIGRPNIINLRAGWGLDDAEQLVHRLLIDVAANSIDVRSGADRNPFEVRLERGVADTVAEMLALTGDIGMADNTAAIFDRPGGGPTSGTYIAARDTAAVGALGWPEDETARISEDLNAGYMVVALRQPVELRGIQRVGWWRVDPSSGETIGVMDTGFHALDEKVVVERPGMMYGIGQYGSWVMQTPPTPSMWPVYGLGAMMGALVVCSIYEMIALDISDPNRYCTP